MLAITRRQPNLLQHGYNQMKSPVSSGSPSVRRRPFSALHTPRRRPTFFYCKYQARHLAAGGLIQQNGYAAGKKQKQKPDPVVLTPSQQDELVLFKDIGKQFKKARRALKAQENPDLSFDQVLEASGIQLTDREPKVQRMIKRIEKVYGGGLYSHFNTQLSTIHQPGTAIPFNSAQHKLLVRLGILRVEQALPKAKSPVLVRNVVSKNSEKEPEPTPRHRVLGAANNQPPGTTPAMPVFDSKLSKLVTINDYQLNPVSATTPEVPRLSFDLSRVLFNPGVYQLQDPRSRVWNFDPYLGKIMPVSEFNFNALNKYTTSSEDQILRNIALQQDCRYIGSTSSMSGMLCHFHYLLSSFRPLNINNVSRGFGEDHTSFTRLTRGPNAIFLRWKDGTYAVDADKEFDSANILMSLGRSMEKLLTSEKDDFELYRRTAVPDETSKPQSQQGEAYHYSQLGPFLLRSQLDCADPRLPGTGVFDLKTRAVAGVRMMLSNPEAGQGYQIKDRYGTWESYEREYYDMIRAAFLKYSLQVRMGRMDGIFVAFHNVERLFGFQYISLPEMDLALHGQTDSTLGDQEFRLSFKILHDIFDQATAKYPETSIRFHFEAREATKASPPYMYVFAEPVTEDEIRKIQTTSKQEIEAYEERLFNPHRFSKGKGASGLDTVQLSTTDNDGTPTTQGEDRGENIAFFENMMGIERSEKTPPGDDLFGEEEIDTSPEKDILAWKLTVQNYVQNQMVVRPIDLQSSDSWAVKYQLEPQSLAMGKRNYTLCKNRRKSVLRFPQDEDEAVGYYIQQLVNISHEGKKWRRMQDESDSQREQVVLYQTKPLGL